MKKSSIFLLTAFVTFFLQGCFLTSFFPIYTEDTIVFSEELLGVWEDPEGDSGVWTFSKGDDQNYRLYISGMEDNHRMVDTLDAHLVQLNGIYFLDLQPTSFPGGYEGLMEAFFAPVHLFSKVEWEEDQLMLYFPAEEAIRKAVESGMVNLSILEREYYYMLSSSTTELQAFLRYHGADDSLFDDGGLLIKKQ